MRKRKQQGRVLPALLAVAVTLVLLWYLCQSTFGTITISVPIVQPTHVVQHFGHHKTK